MLLPLHGVICLNFCSSLELVFSFDFYSRQFAAVLAVISASVLIWSYFYLSSELVYARFFGLVICFLLSMFLFIFSGSLLCLFVGWDLLGFTSFFLVSFYGCRKSWSSALVTGLTNRLGDCFFFYCPWFCVAFFFWSFLALFCVFVVDQVY